MKTDQPPRLRVLRIYHSAVVRSFRARDHRLRARGVDLVLVSPRRWNEGGRDVFLEVDTRERAWVKPARTFGRHPYLFVYSPLSVARAMRSHRPALIDVHEEPASLATAEVLLLRLLVRSKASVTLYSAQNISKRYPPPFRWIEMWALRTAAAVYCCNEDAAAIIRSKGFDGATPVIGLGVDVDRFAPAPALRDCDGFRLGYVGRLEEHKGVHVLLDALAMLPNFVTLTIAGAGPFSAELRRRAARLGSRVRFVDFIPHHELPSLYRSFDAVVVPSLPTPNWKEQFGRVAVEAMASGVAVIASADGALPEVIGPAGVVVSPGNAEALAGAIRQVVDDDNLRERLAAAAKGRAQHYSWARVADDHLAMYTEAAAP